MEYFNETICLGVDILILGLFYKEYQSHKQTLKLLKSAEQISLDESLKSKLESRSNNKIPFAILRGSVSSIGVPIKSVLAPSVSGVLQIIKLSEHRVARGFVGFWTEQRKLIHLSSNEVPFTISNGTTKVEVVNALSASVLDMDVVYDNYEPSSLSFFDHIFGFFSGVRQRGIQTTEEMLRDGSFITAIGELELENNNLRLQASEDVPMFLTTATKNVLIRKFEEAKSSTLYKIVICGTISVVLLSIIGRRFYLKKKQERDERRFKKSLEDTRHKRRAVNRQKDLPEELRCVVCVENPKEVILLPCGHVCICEDCSNKILLTCPLCRKKIESKSAAFI